MRLRMMATYRGVPYEAGVGPSGADVVLFAACPPPEELGFEPATGHWRKRVIRAEVDALWESRPIGSYRGEPCVVLDDLSDRLHIAYLGNNPARAAELGYWQIDRGVFELLTPREEVTALTEERVDHPLLTAAPMAAAGYPYGGPPDTAPPAPGLAAPAPGLAPLAPGLHASTPDPAAPTPPLPDVVPPATGLSHPATDPSRRPAEGLSRPATDLSHPAEVLSHPATDPSRRPAEGLPRPAGDLTRPVSGGPSPYPSGSPLPVTDGWPSPGGVLAGAPGGRPHAAAAAPPDGGGRASRRQRVATRDIFCELADLAAIPRSAYALETEAEGALCLLPAAGGFEVFVAAEGAKHEVRTFADEEAAYFYLFGVLAAEAVRSGSLVASGAPVTGVVGELAPDTVSGRLSCNCRRG
jgi:hypothetical protein